MLSLLNSPLGFATMPHEETNPCTTGADPDTGKPRIWTALADTPCEGAAVQSGADVTEGKVGTLLAGLQPITASYNSVGMCPVNVHWHLGAEHRNEGTYDQAPPAGVLANPGAGSEPPANRRRAASEGIQAGHWCPEVTDTSINMTEEYKWDHCKDMHVGYTYEIHWPHSNLGACGTKWQYQSHFMDGAPGGLPPASDTPDTPPPSFSQPAHPLSAGVLCKANEGNMEPGDAVAAVFGGDDGIGVTDFNARGAKLGVHAQVFTLTNDDAHDYNEWDMMTGFNKNLAENVAIYQVRTAPSHLSPSRGRAHASPSFRHKLDLRAPSRAGLDDRPEERPGHVPWHRRGGHLAGRPRLPHDLGQGHGQAVRADEGAGGRHVVRHASAQRARDHQGGHHH